MRLLGFTLLLTAGTCCFAQDWAVGIAGGYGFYNDATIKNAAGTSAQAGFAPQFAAGAALTENLYQYIGGELRYTFRNSDAELKSQGRGVNLDAYENAVHYDFLFYATPRRARIRPFAAAGAGIVRFDGIGRTVVGQGFDSFAVLAHNHQVEGMLSFGGGVKISMGDRWVARLDFRDYATPVPGQLFASPKGAVVQGWLHDFVPMVGIDYTFGGR